MYKAQVHDVTLPHSPSPYTICMQQFNTLDTEFESQLHDAKRFFSHQGHDYWNSIVTTQSLLPTWLRTLIFSALLGLSGLFSGLGISLMGFEPDELHILKKIGTPKEQSHAKKILPLRERGNFLLCSILLANVLVNSVSTLILGDMVSGLYAAIGSTFLIVTFGEIVPQAICSKYGLAIGASTSNLMRLIMLMTCPLSYPISKLLDFVLGREMSNVYGRDKIRELLKNVEGIDEKEFKIITGALDFNKKRVKEVMTPLNEVFMLELSDKLDFETIANIASHGFSRIPVYHKAHENIIGLLHVKDFTLLDPDDNMPVKELLEFYNHKVVYCYSDRLIDQMFEEFRTGETHLAFVSEIITPDDRDPYELCVGIITLEDILEELIQMEIYDELDNKSEIVKNEQIESEDKRLISVCEPQSESTSPLPKPKVSKADSTPASGNHLELKEFTSVKRSSMKKSKEYKQNLAKKLEAQTPAEQRFELHTLTHDLNFFIQQDKDNKNTALISTQMRFVMFQFLMSTVKPFTNEFLTRNVLELIIKRCSLIESKRHDRKIPPQYLYKYGIGCNYFILVLAGEATIEVGSEKLEFPAGPFTYFGARALLAGSDTAEAVLQESEAKPKKNRFYYPDFSLRVDDHCVYMKLDRDLWKQGVIKSSIEKKNPQHLTENFELVPSENPSSNMGSITITITESSSPSNCQASPTSNNMSSRRNSYLVDALNKVHQKIVKATSQHKLASLDRSQESESDSLIKKSVSVGSIKSVSDGSRTLNGKSLIASADNLGYGKYSDHKPYLGSENLKIR